MNKEDIISKLRPLVVEKLKLDMDPDNLQEDVSLLELGLGIDSVSTLEFILLLESEFNIEIDESDINLNNLSNLNNLTEYIISLI